MKILGSPPKPSGDSRGFGGESRSSGMSELSPPGGSERYGACDDEGAAFGRPQAFPPQGGRWPEGPDEGADERGITPVGTLISLTSLDSFPLEGGSLFA